MEKNEIKNIVNPTTFWWFFFSLMNHRGWWSTIIFLHCWSIIIHSREIFYSIILQSLIILKHQKQGGGGGNVLSIPFISVFSVSKKWSNSIAFARTTWPLCFLFLGAKKKEEKNKGILSNSLIHSRHCLRDAWSVLFL